MRKRKFLTVANKKKARQFLKEYLLTDVLPEEEYLNTLEKCRKDAERVEVYGARRFLTASLVAEWLRGLPLGTEYMTFDICKMILSAVEKDSSVEDFGKVYVETMVDIDNYYWNTLAEIIFFCN